jgi:hypothetical protein
MSAIACPFRPIPIALGLFFSLFFSLYTQLQASDTPHEIAGIALGTDVNSYPAITDSNFMKEVVVTDWHGFRKGVISYGICLNKDLILKIDMKYKDSSKSFYKELLERYRKKFGQKAIWAGDSFGLKSLWKWSFVDEDNNRVTLQLQHNSKDSNESLGNMVKLSYPDKIIEERRCFMEMCEQNRDEVDEKYLKELAKSDWSHLIPR